MLGPCVYNIDKDKYMQELKTALQQSIKKAGLSRQMEAYEIIKAFSIAMHEILPDDLIDEINPISFKDGIIKVRCSHPNFSMRLKALEARCIKRTNRILTKNMIKQLFIIS